MKTHNAHAIRILPETALATEEYPNMVETEYATSSSAAAAIATANNKDSVDDSHLADPPFVPIERTASSISLQSIHSSNEFGNSCRICRFNRSDMEIISCPCRCTGSVGYIHLECLKRWIMHRHDKRCEICHAQFAISEEHVSFKQMLRTFWCGHCLGLILKHLLYGCTLLPLVHVLLQQELQCLNIFDNGNTDLPSVRDGLLVLCMLFASTGVLLSILEFMTTRCWLIRNVVWYWWMFGCTNDYSLYSLAEAEDSSSHFF